jgi:hypothetical protein
MNTSLGSAVVRSISVVQQLELVFGPDHMLFQEFKEKEPFRITIFL